MAKTSAGRFLVIALLFTLPATAQVNTADIVGKVLDPKGLAVGGAKITVTNTETGFTREGRTGDTGDYAVTLLPAGTYKVTVEKEGFSTTVYEKVELAVGSKQTLDVTLKLGQAREVVTITEEPPLLEFTRSEIGGAVSPLEVKELPILDRNFAGLMYLIPGVRPSHGFDPTKTRVGNLSVNGIDGRAISVNVDGGDNKDNVVGGQVQNFTLEGIQEFNVITNRYTVESGRALGAIVNVVTKSGTNTLHGSAFGLFQSSTFNRKSFFDRSAGPDRRIGTDDDLIRSKPVYHRYHLGGSAGGPLIKDKLFIFGAYEHKREPGSISASPTALVELPLFPLAATVGQLEVPYFHHLLTVKMDHNWSNRHHFSYRYGRERWITSNDQLGNPFITDLSQANSNANQFHDLTIQHSYAMSSNKVNAFNVHFSDFVNEILPAPGRSFTLNVAGGGTATNPRIVFSSPAVVEIGQNVNVPQQTLIRKYQFRDDFSWTVNRHTMKFGANYIYLAKLGGYFFFGANGYEIIFWDIPSRIVTDTAVYPQGFATGGAVRELRFSTGTGRHDQRPHQFALYFQDDWKVMPRLTLNLGLRWDANVDFLPRQLGGSLTETNRTIAILQQVLAANPSSAAAQPGLQRIRDIVGDTEKLRRTIPSWREFQPRVGFAWDPFGSGKHVIRGGYGIAFDQVFQNLTLFSMQQTHPILYQTTVSLATSIRPEVCNPMDPAQPLCRFRFGVDPLPAGGSGLSTIAQGAFGRINDPRMRDPYAQQWSIGWAWQFRPDYAFSADYYHVLGIAEPRVQNINPQILPVCDARYPGSNPADARCVRGATSRFFDRVFVDGGFPLDMAGRPRLEQINMIGTTNRSRFDSINFVLRKRYSRNFTAQASYVLSWSRSWGGRPSSSYSGNAIAIAPENQFKRSEFGPTVVDELQRLTLSGHFRLPYGFEVSPIFQAASARPYGFRAGADTDGDGLITLDRVCEGSTVENPLIPGVRGTPFLCQQLPVGALRGDPFAQLDVRFAKAVKFGERYTVRMFWELHNLANTNNFGNNFGTNASDPTLFHRPQSYFGGTGGDRTGGAGFGAITGPRRSQFGFRFEF